MLATISILKNTLAMMSCHPKISESFCGEDSVEKLIAHYGEDRDAETVDGEETVKRAMTSTEILTEWKTFRQLLVKQPRDTTASQLKELVSNDMLKAMQDCLYWLDDSSFYRFCGEKLLAFMTVILKKFMAENQGESRFDI